MGPLTGTGFGPATVTFGGVAATVTAETATELDVIEPAHAAGAADIVVTNGDVTIELGDVIGLTPTVQLGGVPATVVSTGPTFISVKTPAHAAGMVDVTVTDSGRTATLAGAHTFQ